MKSKVRVLWNWLKNPPVWWLILTYLLTVTVIVGAMLMLFADYEGTALEGLAYTLYVLAAITLTYTVYTLIRFVPRMKKSVVAWIERHTFTRDLMEDFGFRTVMFSVISLGVSIAYGIFNGVLGILTLSIWYGALAAYYVLLAFLRGGILLHHVKSGKVGESAEERARVMRRRVGTYRNCGILLLLLQVALSAAIVQMIFDDRAFSYDFEWMIFAVAAYAFYKIITAIINFFKARRQEDLTVEAIRNINLADALVSILALQTAMLHSFWDEGISVSDFNTATGAAVSLFTLGLGIFMIAKGNKRIKKLKTENTHGE
ncbi:MAG: hypothetical protein IJX39_06635 [Clostridia bacterium]|nr:hypothetical protein [Clostridia bacterium]